MPERLKLTQEELKRILHYEPETGMFKWKSLNKTKSKGLIAGSTCPRGYVSIGIKNKIYKAHRLAWLYVYGEWPKHQIDHIDGNKSNNSIINLRDVKQYLNQQNRSRCTKKNKLGILGVSEWGDGRSGFKAQIKIGGKVKYLGTYANINDAENAYLTAKRIFHDGAIS